MEKPARKSAMLIRRKSAEPGRTPDAPVVLKRVLDVSMRSGVATDGSEFMDKIGGRL
ncbi:hypothetical protein PTKU64_76460 [Paraburkholderia terrae]|uniref:Uncharacterized protein n=1 Tax=Paraburkholderia terrae TaxID=311230 RepID=A0ABM7TY03_9BURK|nr:hypothetical protein PTKU64_76460 [Paraburkholderia terrae]